MKRFAAGLATGLMLVVALGKASVRTTSVAAWLPTYYCERDDRMGWRSASPAQQVLVASRLRYDGWPSCPNPPRYR